MSDERLRRRGLLAEKEQRAQLLALKVRALKRQLNELTDPHRDIKDINTTELRMHVDDLQAATEAFDALLKEIASLREDLGMPRYEIR